MSHGRDYYKINSISSESFVNRVYNVLYHRLLACIFHAKTGELVLPIISEGCMNACVQQIIKERIVNLVVSQSSISSTTVLLLILHFGLISVI